MYDRNVSSGQIDGEQAEWLVLIANIPPKADYARVKLHRRIQRIGAQALKQSVFVLPRREETLEDFEWLRRALVEDGADAIVFAVSPVSGLDDGDLRERFRQARAEDYSEIAETARSLQAGGNREEWRREAAKLRKRLEEVEKVDFFGAVGKEAARGAIDNLSTSQERGSEAKDEMVRGRVWVTRAGVYVDRIASAWLIRQFIDSDARFKFVGVHDYRPLAGEVRFDMYNGEFSHEGDRCTFETLLSRYGISEPALKALGEIVHDIDCKDGKFDRPEAAGVEMILSAIVSGVADDVERLAKGGELIERLYCQLRERCI